MRITKENIFKQAIKGKIKVLNHPEAVTLKDQNSQTVLHILATRGRCEVLEYPEVATTLDYFSNTPLHLLARAGRLEVLKHPAVAKVRNADDLTPLHYLVRNARVTREHLEKLFPFFKVRGRKIDEDILEEIFNIPNSIKFIDSL